MAESATTQTIATGFLAALDEPERADLMQRAHRRRYRRGTTVFHEGGGSDEVVVVLSGRVKVSTVTGDGKEVVLAFRGPGDLLGELSAIDGEPRSATVGALGLVERGEEAGRGRAGFCSWSHGLDPTSLRMRKRTCSRPSWRGRVGPWRR